MQLFYEKKKRKKENIRETFIKDNEQNISQLQEVSLSCKKKQAQFYQTLIHYINLIKSVPIFPLHFN